MNEETRAYSKDLSPPMPFRAKEHAQASPIIETQITTSKDGKWIIHKTIITDIKPITYWKKVVEPKDQAEVVEYANNV